MNSWKDLPNAPNINRVLVSLKNNPSRWSSAMYDASKFSSFKAQQDAVLTARTVCHDRHLTSELEEALNTAWNSAAMQPNAYLAASSAIVALVAYDDADTVMDDEEPIRVRKYASESSEQEMLLLPAVLVFEY